MWILCSFDLIARTNSSDESGCDDEREGACNFKSRLKLHFREGHMAQTFTLNSWIGEKNSVKIFLLLAQISKVYLIFGLFWMFTQGAG